MSRDWLSVARAGWHRLAVGEIAGLRQSIRELTEMPWSLVRVCTALYAAAAVVIAAPLILHGLRAMLDFDWANAPIGDCQVDWAAAKLFLQGKSPYTPEGLAFVGVGEYGFGHPPTTPFWFLPLAGMEFRIVALLIAVATLVCLVLHVVISVFELDLPAPLATITLAVGLTLSASWVIEHFHVVQISEFIAFAYVLAWYWLRRDKQLLAGVALGAACTLKLYPGLMLVFLLVTRRWRAFVAGCGTYLAIAAFMTRGFGLASWKLFFEQQGPIAHYWEGHIRNGSLYGIVLRLFRPSCVKPPENPTAAVLAVKNLARIPALPGMTAAHLAAIAAVTLGIWLVRRYPRPLGARGRTQGLDLQFALFTVLSAFANPWAWEHYCVLMIMPLLVVMAAMQRRARDLWHAEVDARDSRTRREVLGLLFMLLAVVAVGFGLAQDLWEKERLYLTYWHKTIHEGGAPASVHRAMHSYEVLNIVPWVLTLVLLVVLLVLSAGARESRSSAVPGSR